MNTTKGLILFTFAFILAVFAPASRPACAGGGENGGLLYEKWEAYYIKNTKVGYHHEKAVLVKEGDAELVRVEMCDKMKLPRMGQVVVVMEKLVVYETKDGVPLRFEHRVEMGALPMVLKGKMEDGKMNITPADGETIKLDWPKSARLSASHVPLFEGMKFEKDEKMSFKLYIPTFGRFLEHTCTVLGDEKIKVGDREMELHHIRITCRQLPTLVEDNWVDDKGEVLLRNVNMGGIILRSVKTDMETALRDEPLGTLDLLAEWSLKCEQPFYHPYTSNSALYKLSVKKGKVADIKIERDNQKVEKRAEDYLLLRVTAAIPTEKGSLELPVKTDGDMGEFLKPNKFIQSDYEKIIEATRKVVGDEKNSYRAAKALEQWVFEYIEDKDMSVAFASAKEVFDEPRGDCTEHAVLLAAMLRAAGIPSRVCTGVVYTPAMFMWHAWTEAFVGEWVALDATMPYDFVDAAHIAFAGDSMAKTGLGELSLAVMGILGNVKLELVEYTYLEKQGEKRVEKKGLMRGGIGYSKGMAVHRGFKVGVPGYSFESIVAEKGTFKVKRRDRNGHGTVTVLVAPFPPGQFAFIREQFGKKTEGVEDLNFEGARAFRATLKNGGETVIILKGDLLVKAGYEGSNKYLKAMLDDILNGLKFSSE